MTEITDNPTKKTTIPTILQVRKRLSKLAEDRSRKMGLTGSIGVTKYLEMLVAEEESRVRAQEARKQ